MTEHKQLSFASVDQEVMASYVKYEQCIWDNAEDMLQIRILQQNAYIPKGLMGRLLHGYERRVSKSVIEASRVALSGIVLARQSLAAIQDFDDLRCYQGVCSYLDSVTGIGAYRLDTVHDPAA